MEQLEVGSYVASPVDGWEALQDHEEIEEVIWAHLKVRDHGGRWDYYSFTSCGSIFCSGDEPGVQLCLEFGEPGEHRISNVHLEIGETASERYFEMVELVRTLADRFQLQLTRSGH